MKHIHIIGVCGTFMGNLALIARELGHKVTGSDLNAYPPMSEVLGNQDITCFEGYRAENLDQNPDLVLVGNTIGRLNPEVDAMLDKRINYTSGPQWLYENLLVDRKVVTVAGTHGKTTTSSMIAWILNYAKIDCGFLIGGVPQNFQTSSRIGSGEWFVVEGDEYDTAYFDKRSKFIHYRPYIATCLNLQFDHADIFNSIEDIEQQFKYFLRILPSSGYLIANWDDPRIVEVSNSSPWANIVSFSVVGNRYADWYIDSQTDDYLEFRIHSSVHGNGSLKWKVPGRHNAANALAALATTTSAGVELKIALEALQSFKPVKRRLEFLGEFASIRVYDDFAHHPTAIRASIDAISKAERPKRLVAVFEPRSNTMRMGVHGQSLIDAFEAADLTYMYRAPNVEWSPNTSNKTFHTHESVETLLEALLNELRSGDCVLIMSNGGFNNLHSRLTRGLAAQA